MTSEETAAAAAAITAATTATPTPSPAPVPVALPPSTIPIPADQLQNFLGLQAQIDQLEADNRTRETAATEERVRILTEKNQAVEAIKLVRDTHAADMKAANDARTTIEESAKRYALDGTLARVLASAPIVPAAAGQLIEMWRKEFVVVQENGTFAVRTPTFQTVEAFVAEKLAHVDYAHFVRAKTQGGTAGTTGGHNAGPTGAAATPDGAPRTLQEAIMRQIQETQRDNGGNDPRLNPRLPMLHIPSSKTG